MQYSYRKQGTCSQMITFDLNDNKVSNIKFYGGCDGNLKAISKILEGADADFVVKTLTGNTCGPRPTSCADQLANAVRQAQAKAAQA